MAVAQREGRVGAVRRLVVRVLFVELAALLVTGVYLVLFYRPSAAQAWSAAYGLHEDTTLPAVVRTAHRWLAWGTIATAAVVGGVLVGEGASRWRGSAPRRRGVATGPLVFLLTAAALVTGVLLPWDQIALWKVTVGTNLSGYRPLFDDDTARFVLIGGSEVSLGTIRTVLAVHAVVVPAALAGLLLFSNRRRRPRAPAAAVDAGTDRQDVGIAATEGLPHTG
ncbi:MAG: cytochrome b N-terminal domain-containing protein [Aquihabitans sp.]